VSHIDPHHLACRDAVELVTDYLEGALGPEDLSAFEEHLVFCDPCVVYLDNLRRIRSATRALAAEQIDPDLLQKLGAALRLTQSQK
jgi:anti-sigma factor RsiW